MSNKIINVNDDTFENDILKATGLFLVDFWAHWCDPCKKISPILSEIADEFYDKLTVAKINIDENPNIAPKYGIRGIPALLLFRHGKVIANKVGMLSKEQLKEFITDNL